MKMTIQKANICAAFPTATSLLCPLAGFSVPLLLKPRKGLLVDLLTLCEYDIPRPHWDFTGWLRSDIVLILFNFWPYLIGNRLSRSCEVNASLMV